MERIKIVLTLYDIVQQKNIIHSASRIKELGYNAFIFLRIAKYSVRSYFFIDVWI